MPNPDAIDPNTPKRLSLEQRIYVLRLWYSCRGDIREILRLWRDRERQRLQHAAADDIDDVGHDDVAPYRSIDARTVRAIAHRFQQYGSVRDKPRDGRPRSVRTDEIIDMVRDSVRAHPLASTRKRAKALNLSRSSLMRIQKYDLHLYPYKLQLVHKLFPVDTGQRIATCERMLLLAAKDVDWINRVIMGDEAHFDLSGAVFNRQNVRFWGTENPRLHRPQTLHCKRVTVWCGVSSCGILGPYFFENERGDSASVTGERYRDMLRTYVQPLLRRQRRYRVVRDWWWQQDGATAHTARQTLTLLRKIFHAKRLISRGTCFPWPARSPDLSPPDFFLWGFLKDRVYAFNTAIDDAAAAGVPAQPVALDAVRFFRTLETIDELKRAIVREVNALNDPSNDALRQRVMNSVLERARLCVQQAGGHLLDMVFRT